MFADFRWKCANYVYTSLEVFSTSAYEKVLAAARSKKIQRASIVTLKMHPRTTQKAVETAIAEMIKESDCLATVVTAQTPQKADVIYHAFRLNYEGQILMIGDVSSIPSILHHRLMQDATKAIKKGEKVDMQAIDAKVNHMMRGVFVVEAFNGAGTERLALMKFD